MTPPDAAKLLDLPVDATPEQLETRFLELRTKLEDKIAKAPTPGLKAKYRESLDQVITAFETLTLAADSSSLPVIQKNVGPDRHRPGDGGSPLAGGPSAHVGPPLAGVPSPAKRPKSGGKEFLIVALIAVLILGAGGWFVMKTRAENEAKAAAAAKAQAATDRRTAAAKAEQDRAIENARIAAEEKKKAEEAERIRQEKLIAQLRADLAEAKIAWDAVEREERTAERRLSELKSDLRSLREPPAGRLAEAQAMVAAQQDYSQWLSDTIARHPARIARGRAEEMLAARQPDDARPVIKEMSAALQTLEAEIARRRQAAQNLDGTLAIKTHPDARWVVTDAFGRSHRGTGPGTIAAAAVGRAEAEFSLPFWQPRKETVTVPAGKSVELVADFETYDFALESKPTGANVILADGTAAGPTPLRLKNLPAGALAGVVQKQGFRDQPFRFTVGPAGPASAVVTLAERPTQATWPTSRKLPARMTVETRSESATTTGRSTGSYAGAGGDTNHHSQIVEDWQLSDPDADGRWQRLVRTFVRQDGTHAFSVTTGTVIEYRRASSGKWRGEILEGRLSSEGYRPMVLEQFTPETLTGLEAYWPPAGTPIGGTWKINVPAQGGTTTGRLLSFNKEPNRDWVEFEFSSRTSKKDKNDSSEYLSTTRVSVDLAGYVIATTNTYRSSSTSKVPLVGVLAVDVTGSTSTTYTVKPN